MNATEIATADIDTINRRQDALRGDDSTEAGIERGLIERRREELAIEVYGPSPRPRRAHGHRRYSM